MNQQHGMPPAMGSVNPAMGISPMMQQQSPQQNQQQAGSISQQASLPPNAIAGAPGGVHPSQQQQSGQPAQQPPTQQSTDKVDNISKVKSLAIPLRETLAMTLKTAAQCLTHNTATDNGTTKTVDNNLPRFDKHLEEFYSICDQIELHLKTSILCMQQSSASQRYLPVPVATTRVEPMQLTENGPISYPQYLSTIRTQIAYAKDLHDTLICAAQNMSPNNE